MINKVGIKYISVSVLSLLSLAMGPRKPEVPTDHFDQPGMTQPLEEPAKYTSVQLRDRARQYSFSSRSEFERMVNAKLNARLRYLNLIPHLSAGSALAIGARFPAMEPVDFV